MSKNKLSDLNDHLFMQLERLGDEELTPEQIEIEAKRAEAIVDVADRIVSNAALQLKAAALLVEHGEYVRPMLPAIAGPAQ
jgi:hypothetical protein